MSDGSIFSVESHSGILNQKIAEGNTNLLLPSPCASDACGISDDYYRLWVAFNVILRERSGEVLLKRQSDRFHQKGDGAL